MTKISTVYAALISQIESTFGSKSRLHNPYNLENNPDIVRKNAWGLKVGDAEPQTLEFCNLSLSRSYTFILMRQFVTLSSKEDGFDAVTVAMLEDQQSFAQLIFNPTQLGVEDDIEVIEISSISGINELESDEKKYLFTEVTFTILISELIS